MGMTNEQDITLVELLQNIITMTKVRYFTYADRAV
jgi:hypothetical protein